MPLTNQPSESFWQAQKAADLSPAPSTRPKSGVSLTRQDTSRRRKSPAIAKAAYPSEQPEPPKHIYFHVPGLCAPKPRQTRADKWKQRPCVLRYRAWADKARAEMRKVAGVSRLETARTIHVKAYLPMPASWPAKKKHEMRGVPHRQKPDADNLIKSIDAIVRCDESIYKIEIYKEWAIEGQERTEIYITT